MDPPTVEQRRCFERLCLLAHGGRTDEACRLASDAVDLASTTDGLGMRR